MLFFIILMVVWLESPCIDDFSQDCHKGYLRERIKIMRFGGGQRPKIQEHQCNNTQYEAQENNPTNRITVIEEITVFSICSSCSSLHQRECPLLSGSSSLGGSISLIGLSIGILGKGGLRLNLPWSVVQRQGGSPSLPIMM